MALSTTEQGLLRLEIFDEIERAAERRGGAFTRDELVNFEVGGRRLGVIDRNRGIRNPREFDETLSVVTSHDGPYTDHFAEANTVLRYSHQGADFTGGDNVKLRRAMERQTPIILFDKPLPNVYIPHIGAYVVGEDQDTGHFLIALDDRIRNAFNAGTVTSPIERAYALRLVRQRLHQQAFRQLVINAYGTKCAICRLQKPTLLDASHITPDADELGLPVITNGLSLCKIHHAAYDQNMVGVDGNYRVHVDHDLLAERDGPMLRHGIQEMDGVSIATPRSSSARPDRDRLDARFQLFRSR